MLGGFKLETDGVLVDLSLSTQRAIAFLALHDRPVARSHLAASLWLDVTDSRAQGNLRSALWRIGKTSPTLVLTPNSHLQLAPSVAIDVHENEARAHRLLARMTPCSGADLDIGSLASDVLPEWQEDWVLLERERFRQVRLHALEALCGRLSEVERFGEAIEAGLAAVSAEPLRESASRVLIAVYLAEGNSCEAARHYRSFRELLQDELRLEPSSAMKELVGHLSL